MAEPIVITPAPGRYRVRVLTQDGREIGRKSFRFVVGEPVEQVEELD